VIALILAGVGLNPATIGLILGVDRFLHMGRTELNLVAAQVLSATVLNKTYDPARPTPSIP
jgi:Na+/H+-dicarboxylate symporter